MNERIQYYDNLRAFACFLVILTHSGMPGLDKSLGIYMALISLFASPSSELFIAISSSLLAPTKLGMMEFYKKRFSKLLWPFLFWSIFMVGYRYFSGQIDSSIAISRILLFPFKATEGVYWFVYIIAALYLLNPIISPWLKNATRKEFHFVLGLWFLTLLLPLLNMFTGQNIYNINGNYYFILNYMGGFWGYMLIGVYLKKYPVFIINKIKAFFLVTGLLVCGTIPFLIGYLFGYSAGTMLENNLSLTSAFYVIAIFIFFKNFSFPAIAEKSLSVVAKYSFGIYLIHILIVREVVWKLLANTRLYHPFIETPIIAFISLLMCLAIVKILSYLPKSQYIIGV